MVNFCCDYNFRISLVSIQQSLLLTYYKFHGLVPKMIKLDDETSISCWTPRHPGRPKKHSRLEKKSPVLLLHGFGASAIWQWYHQVAPLSLDYDVYMPDLVFFGDSTSSSSLRTERWQAECMVKMLDKLQVDCFDVVGISYGGFVACRLAQMLPQRIKRLVLTDSGVGMTSDEYQNMLNRWQVKDAGELLLAQTPSDVNRLLELAYYKPPRLPKFLLQDTLEVLFQNQVEEKRELLVEIAKYARQPLEEDMALPQKVLLIWGEYDEVFPPTIAERLQWKLGNQCRTVIIKNACHMPNGDQAKEYNKALLAFLMEETF